MQIKVGERARLLFQIGTIGVSWCSFLPGRPTIARYTLQWRRSKGPSLKKRGISQCATLPFKSHFTIQKAKGTQQWNVKNRGK